MAYQVNDGRIQTWALEAHVVDQCNLRCAECCTLSPHLPDRMNSPDDLHRDLVAAARVLRPAVFKLTGGEPMLHPDLVACVEAARASGISNTISLTTNGFHAPRMPDALWRGLDRLTLSLYPSAPLPASTLAAIRQRCAEHGIALTEKPASHFQKLTPDAPWSVAEARAVHSACWLKVRCHLVHGGRFFACTRPPHLAQLGYPIDDADGVGLHERDPVDLLADLVDYLESSEPLSACRSCLGAGGERLVHRQLGRDELRRLPFISDGG